MNELAIVSVPIQPWEEPDDLKPSLNQGTIFPSLRKPFFIEKEMPNPQSAPLGEEERLLCEIQQTTFALIDATLYLDTHPGEEEARMYREGLRIKRRELLDHFAKAYYPLTMDCGGCWNDGPLPWE